MSRTPLKIELIQANARVGDIESNLEMVLENLERSQADLLVFPECFLTGYPLQDLVLRPSFLALIDQGLDRIARAVRDKGGAGVLIGAPLSGTDLPYNAAHLLSPDGTRQVAIKCELPNTDVFDERRTFARGMDPKPLQFKDWHLGVMVCEDMWHGFVARTLRDENADVFIVINGSPMEIGKQAIRREHAENRVRANQTPLVYLNLVGGQDELVFDGSSFVIDHAGNCLVEVPFVEAIIPLELTQIKGVTQIQADKPIALSGEAIGKQYPETLESVYHTLTLGLHDYVRKNGFSQILLGLSGGVDSALVAALAVDALGPDALLSIMMPATYTGEESKSLAHEMATILGCRYIDQPVGTVVNEVEGVLNAALASSMIGTAPTPSARSLASENIQARSRGNFLMALSNALPGALVLSTGNKSEMSVGYATLYGDMCGGFNPIKDLYKTVVFDLCHWRNANHRSWMKGPDAPIPERIITRPPTAELAADQSDEKSLGSYPVLDAVLEQLIEQMQSPEAAAREASRQLNMEVSVDYAKRIARLVQRAEYKRRQAPPGIKLTSRSFGFGWRYPITNAASL